MISLRLALRIFPTRARQGGRCQRWTMLAQTVANHFVGGPGPGLLVSVDEERDGVRLYRWQMLPDAEAAALIKGELRGNQQPDQ